MGHTVLGLLRPVVEIDLAVDDLDIVQSETRRRPGRSRSEFVDQILKIIFEILFAHEIHIGFHQAQFFDHRRKTK